MLHQTVLRIRIIILDADPYQMKQIRNTATSSKQDPDPFSILMCDCVSELGQHKNPPHFQLLKSQTLPFSQFIIIIFYCRTQKKNKKKLWLLH